METVLFRFFFHAPAKIQTLKTQEDKKRKGLELVQNRNEQGKHVCLEKVLFNFISKALASSESKSMANVLQ